VNLQGLLPAHDVVDIAVAGATWLSAIADYPTQAAPNFNAAREMNALIVRLGANDLIGGVSAATMQTRALSYFALARATGFKVIPCTITPAIPAVYTAPIEAERTTWNTWVRSLGPATIDGLLDLDAIPELQDPTDLDYFDADGWHTWGPLANPLIASAALTSINAL
jgi:hypothetical protein